MARYRRRCTRKDTFRDRIFSDEVHGWDARLGARMRNVRKRTSKMHVWVQEWGKYAKRTWKMHVWVHEWRKYAKRTWKMHILGSRLRCMSGCIASKKCPQVCSEGMRPSSSKSKVRPNVISSSIAPDNWRNSLWKRIWSKPASMRHEISIEFSRNPPQGDPPKNIHRLW